jgi:hypothetical protein
MKKLQLLFFFLVCAGEMYAQLIDTIQYSLHQKPKYFITLASHSTFIDGEYASIGGVRMGLNYNQRVRFGIGYFELTNNAVVSTIHFSENNLEYETAAQLYLHYFSLSAEYYFFNRYPWQCTVTPFNLGYGRAKYEYVRRTELKKVFSPSETVILYQPETSVQYSIFKWLGVGATTGYRFTLLRSKKQTQHLDDVTFALDIRLFVDELYKMIAGSEEDQ